VTVAGAFVDCAAMVDPATAVPDWVVPHPAKTSANSAANRTIAIVLILLTVFPFGESR
jgi:hypothetical protein